MKKNNITIYTLVLGLIFTSLSTANAAADDCKTGYVWQRMSGVGCVQENCNEIPDAHYSYTGYCICGSSGSINESPQDPNKACSYGADNESCPSCVYACVHANEECPGDTNTQSSDISSPDTSAINTPTLGTPTPDIPTSGSPSPYSQTPNTANAQNSPATTQATVPPVSLTTASVSGRTCEQECKKLTRGGEYDDVLEASGTYPNCKCTVDNKDKDNHTIETIRQDGDLRTTYTFDPATDRLIKKETISMIAERERIRESLGFTYTEDQIDQLLDDATINDWFSNKMQNIETNASIMTPAFWWQHFIALLDHGYGNSSDFVDINNFGRCGDSMEWLEKNLAGQLNLTGKSSEAMLSITGEKYGNAINHTALIIRPSGIGNIEWADLVMELTTKTGNGGFDEKTLEYIDPRLLDAKVLDPYFKKRTTVREFIKGWSVIKIS